MQTIISNISARLKQAYQKAEDYIEDEREFPMSQVFLNATFQRFVTDNVKMLKDLHADLHDDWLRLYATLDYNGLNITLSVDLKLFDRTIKHIEHHLYETHLDIYHLKLWFHQFVQIQSTETFY